MFKAWQTFHRYHAILGFSGVAALVFARLSGTRPLFRMSRAGIKHPIYLRIGTTDASVFGQVLVERHYDLPLEIIPRVIVDAGANIGLAAVFFTNKYPDATIIAIEPEESNFKVLDRNTALYPRIKRVKAALWKEDKEISIFDPGVGDHGFQTVEGDAGKCGQRLGFVQGITMATLMSRMGLESVDLLKIDIEGAEKEVFENSKTWIGKVGAVMAELHDPLQAGCERAFLEATAGFDDGISKGETVLRRRKQIAR